MKILVVDDNEDARVLTKTILASQGHTVEVSVNGIQALETAKHFSPALIISDIMMPEMDGFELCRAVKEDDRLKSIPVVLFTVTYTDPQDQKLAMDVGASRFITKPMETFELINIINEVLEEFRGKESVVPKEPRKSREELDHLHYRSVAAKLNQKAIELDEANRALRKSEQKYRHLVENLREEYFFYSHGTNGVFTYVSPSITDVLGYSQNEFFKHYTEYLTPDPINKEVERHSELSMKGTVQLPYEVEIYHKDGTARLLEIREVPAFDDHGNVIAVEGIAHDITERKKTDNILRQTLKEKEILLQEVHHRVKNNLLTLYSLINLQQEGLSGNEDINYILDITKQRIHTMGKVHHMLYQSGSFWELDFSEYIRSMVSEPEKIYRFAEKKIDVSLNLESVILTIGEAIPCGLILNELLMNAYQHAFIDRESGHISIYFSKKDDVHELQISDDGVGMPEEVMSGEVKTLGLQLVTMLTNQLKGEISYKRENGSIFNIVF